MHAIHATHPRARTLNTINTLPITPTLPAVATDPATARLSDTAIAPAPEPSSSVTVEPPSTATDPSCQRGQSIVTRARVRRHRPADRGPPRREKPVTWHDVTARKPPSTRLSVEDWLKAGDTLLAEQGGRALKVERLCQQAGVTRGSFYWDFADIDSYRAAQREHLLDLMLAEPT